MIARHDGEYPLTLRCRVLAVARSTFYAWRGRPPSLRAESDAALRVLLAAQHKQPGHGYGPRPHRHDLAVAGYAVSRRRVGRLMRESGLVAVPASRRPARRPSEPPVPAAPNRLDQQFTVGARDRVWAADLTYCWTQEGWLYLAALLDLSSRRVVGWAASATADHRVVLAAWDRAVALRQPAPGLLHHSDRGSVYRSARYQQALAAQGAVVSMSGRGACWDNAVVESFFATLKRGLVHRRSWASRRELTQALTRYIDRWYNQERRHSTLGYISPAEYERTLLQAA